MPESRHKILNEIFNIYHIKEMERARAQGIYYNVPKLKKETENPK